MYTFALRLNQFIQLLQGPWIRTEKQFKLCVGWLYRVKQGAGQVHLIAGGRGDQEAGPDSAGY